jgi:hypothetical protein
MLVRYKASAERILYMVKRNAIRQTKSRQVQLLHAKDPQCCDLSPLERSNVAICESGIHCVLQNIDSKGVCAVCSFTKTFLNLGNAACLVLCEFRMRFKADCISLPQFARRTRTNAREARLAQGECSTSRRFRADNAGVSQIAIGKAQIVEKAQKLESASSALRIGKRKAREEVRA